MIPSDPYMLLSFANMKLRDEYSDLADFCASLDIDENYLKETMASISYFYDKTHNAFVSV